MVAVEPGGEVRALSRSGRDITATYPELRRLATLVPAPVVLDGELVVVDEAGRPSFRRHQERMQVRAPTQTLVREVPAQLYAFDLLHAGESLLDLPYEQRRQALDELLAYAEYPLRIPPSYTDMTGAELLEVARETGLEGVVSKRLGSRYEPGKRTRNWIKSPLRASLEVLVCGWVPGRGRHTGVFGSLLLGVHDEADNRLRYVGNVGTGFTDRDRATLQAMLVERARPDSPFDEPIPPAEARDAHWVTTDLIGEVQHREWIRPENRLRHPSWRGLRTDVRPNDVKAPFFD